MGHVRFVLLELVYFLRFAIAGNYALLCLLQRMGILGFRAELFHGAETRMLKSGALPVGQIGGGVWSFGA
jgi:hypothetical protein